MERGSIALPKLRAIFFAGREKTHAPGEGEILIKFITHFPARGENPIIV